MRVFFSLSFQIVYLIESTQVVSTHVVSTQLESTATEVESVDVASGLLPPKPQAVNNTDKITIEKITFFIL